MPYGLLYQSTFDPIDTVSATPIYRVEILKKGYTGADFNITGASTPVVHSWQTDDPKSPIKGSSLQLSFINKGSLPLTSFFAQDDDTFKVKFYWNTQLLFEGFLVQDDCNEIMVDYLHEINLSATDNLGLLKKVDLDKAPGSDDLLFTSLETIDSAANVLGTDLGFGSTVQLGDKIGITGSPHDGKYTVLSYTIGGGRYFFTVTPSIGDITPPIVVTLGLYRTSLLEKVSLLNVIKRCISAAGLEIDTHIFSNIFETNQTYGTPTFDTTLVDLQTFLRDDINYEDCYSVLEKILKRFGCTLFQSKGVWNIIRWDELRYYNNKIPGYIYNSSFAYVGSITSADLFSAGIGQPTKVETGFYRKILRPFEFVKETFNYKQPSQLLRNFNLQNLGTPITTYTTGSGVNLRTITEYKVPFWYDSPLNAGVVSDYFIRVVSDNIKNEIERYLVVKKDDIVSYKIEVNQGDTFKYSFSYKTADSQPGPINHGFKVELIGTATRFVRQPGRTPSEYIEPGWGGGPGWDYNIPVGDNTNEWHTVTIESQPIPFDGLLYCFLDVASPNTNNETHYKDIRFEYTPLINQSTKIIGHTHKNSQVATIKNNDDSEIFIDSSPRNSIAGTLFLNELQGVLQKRTKQWKRATVTEARNLGDIITFEEMFYRRFPRTILEGTMIGNTASANHITMLSVIKYTYLNNLNFIFGKLDINYKNNTFNGTLWEIYKDGEADSDLFNTYEFKYLYAQK